MTIHVVQHTAGEFLGLIEDHLEGRGVRFQYWRPFTGGGALPRPDALDDGLILLGGGPWGTAGERDLPTLAAEVALVRTCLVRALPVVGIGAGAQVLALACGGRPDPAPLRFEVGTARRSAPQALRGYLPEAFPLAVYMRDWPAPPPGAEVLARDDEGRAALWQWGERALGFAGHPGLKLAMVEDLIMEFEEAPPDYAPALDRLRAVQRNIEDALVPIMTGVVAIAGWIATPP